MQPIVTDRVASSVGRSLGLSVCLSVCLSVTLVSPAKTAEPIEMPFGLWPRVGPRKHVLYGDQIPRAKGQLLGVGGKYMPGHARRHSAVSCTKMAEPL